MIWPLKKISLDLGKSKPFIVSVFLSSEWRNTVFHLEKAVGKKFIEFVSIKYIAT